MTEDAGVARFTTGGVEFLRTPEDRFLGLPDFDYEPSFVEVKGLRMAYLDIGATDAPTVLLLHGEPAWGFLYRRMIPLLTSGGFRCVVPDLIGFGRSDKPTSRASYSYNGHVKWLHAFLDLIDLPEQSRLFAQDWGGLLGLRLVAERPNQFGHVAIGNTALPTGQSAGEGFDAWLAYSQSPQFAAPESIGRLFRRRRPTPPDLHTGRTLRPRRPRRGHRSRSSRLVEPCRLTRPHLWRPQPAVGHH